jgi:hypothetical protein
MIKHGHNGPGGPSPEYRSWAHMIERCKNPNADNYRWYGGRGIKVCRQWANFAAFLADMGPRPSLEHSIERRDNSLGYTPANCYWATRHDQQRNKVSSRMLTWKGRTMCAADWAAERGLKRPTLCWRLKSGWSVARALSTPIGGRR